MTSTLKPLEDALGIDTAALRAKYRTERDRRLRSDGLGQFVRIDRGHHRRYEEDRGEALDTARQPLTDTILIATGTGVAPMLGFVQHLFPEDGADRSEGRKVWLVYGTRHETELYYRDYFEKITAQHSNFHYIATLSRAPESWGGHRGYVQEFVGKIAEEHAASCAPDTVTAVEPAGFNIHAYICGLNEMVSANRERLMSLGWQRKQIIFERYD